MNLKKIFIWHCLLISINALCWNGTFYNKNSQLQQEEALECLTRSNVNLQPNASILDIGCGSGKLTQQISQLTPEGNTLGIDASQDMITFAQKTYAKSTLNFNCIDAREITFYNKFNLVTSFACLHWIRELDIAFKNVYNALRKNGIFIFRMTGYTHPTEQPLTRLINSTKWQSYFNQFDPQWFYPQTKPAVQKMLQQAQFNIIRIDVLTKTKTFTTNKEFGSWIQSYLPHFNHIPKSLHDSFLEDLVETYLEINPLNSDGSITVEKYVIEVEAYK